MEQATLQVPAALEYDAPESRQSSLDLRQRFGLAASKLAVAGLCAAVTVAGAFMSSRAMDSQANIPGITRVAPDYEPLDDLRADSNDGEKITREVAREYRATGNAVDIVGADQDAGEAFANFFTNGTATASGHIPQINEIVRIQDRQLFAPELDNHPNVYPFIVYNTTHEPVDVLYLEFALQATRTWLNEMLAHGGRGEIGGHTLLKVAPIADPHAMIMTNEMPTFMTNARRVGNYGATVTYPGSHTASFILGESDAPGHPFSPEAVAAEVCQAMVNVYGEQSVPGGRLQQAAMQRKVALFSPDSIHNLDLASQESVCNGLAWVVATAYRAGEAGLEELPGKVGMTGGLRPEPWINMGMYAPEFEQMLRLKEKLLNGPSGVITGRSDVSPTASYYRQHLPAGPPASR